METPWAWYIVRSSGIVALFLFFVMMTMGLLIRTPVLKKLISPYYTLQAHCWLATNVVFFAMVHALGLFFDKYLLMHWQDIFIPFASEFKPLPLSLGIIGLYGLFILTFTSVFKKFLGQRGWRTTHFLHLAVFPMVFFHAISLGTDLQTGVLRNTSLAFGVIITILLCINMFQRVVERVREKGPE